MIKLVAVAAISLGLAHQVTPPATVSFLLSRGYDVSSVKYNSDGSKIVILSKENYYNERCFINPNEAALGASCFIDKTTDMTTH